MTVIAKELVPIKIAEVTSTVQYTVPPNFTTIIDKFTATNISAADVALSVYTVPVGANASDSNIIVRNRLISPNRTYTFPEMIGHVMAAGTMLATLASTAGATTLKVSGREAS
jgi:hypothetical protein